MSLSHFTKSKRIVIKIGSHVLTNDKGLRAKFIADLAKQVAFLKRQGVEVVLVSSGAIALAMQTLSKNKAPKDMAVRQALAAIGQPLLMQHYIKIFAKEGLQVAQVLLTHSDLKRRKCLNNARQAMESLLKMNVVPIVNENDTVAVEEIRFGDNDRLSAFVAKMLKAQFLVIFSHVDGLFDDNPRTNPKAKLLQSVKQIDKKIKKLIYAEVSLKGTGGMVTKVTAAKYCNDAGIAALVTSGFYSQTLVKLWKQGSIKGTYFWPKKIKKA